MASTQVNATASLSANGTSTATGTMSWSAPSLPSGAVVTDITVSGTWTWNGRGNISRLTINGHQVSADTPFSVSVGTSSTSTALTCRGNNKNASGNNFGWSDLIATYTYEVPASDMLYLKVSGAWTEVSTAYKKVNGSWVEQDIASLFDTDTNYVKGD